MTPIEKMSWNVYRYSINERKIYAYNVFDHWKFAEEVQEMLKENLTYDQLDTKLRHSAMYYFWSKCEHEIVLTSFPPYIDKTEINRFVEEADKHKYCTSVNLETGCKVDVYDQLRLNWEHFVDYIWSCK